MSERNYEDYKRDLDDILKGCKCMDQEWLPAFCTDVTDRESFLETMGRMWDLTPSRGKFQFVANEEGITLAVTGVSENSQAHAELIAFVINNLQAVSDHVDDLERKLAGDNDELLDFELHFAEEDLRATKAACSSGTVACRLWHALDGLVREIKERRKTP